MASKIDTSKLVAYLVFQGGGAKGISHVGGLAAVNELKLTIGGVAGTSAGAIVAALVAGGYPQQLAIVRRAHLIARRLTDRGRTAAMATLANDD
jgi:predicted acylesterase/phospholipase RssA